MRETPEYPPAPTSALQEALGPIDLNTEYVTRSGQDVKIFAVGVQGKFPVVGMHFDPNTNGWIASSWTENGEFSHGAYERLSLVKAKKQVFLALVARSYTPSGSISHRFRIEIHDAPIRASSRQKAELIAVEKFGDRLFSLVSVSKSEIFKHNLEY